MPPPLPILPTTQFPTSALPPSPPPLRTQGSCCEQKKTCRAAEDTMSGKKWVLPSPHPITPLPSPLLSHPPPPTPNSPNPQPPTHPHTLLTPKKDFSLHSPPPTPQPPQPHPNHPETKSKKNLTPPPTSPPHPPLPPTLLGFRLPEGAAPGPGCRAAAPGPRRAEAVRGAGAAEPARLPCGGGGGGGRARFFLTKAPLFSEASGQQRVWFPMLRHTLFLCHLFLLDFELLFLSLCVYVTFSPMAVCLNL